MQHSHPFLSRYVVPDMPSADELRPYLRQIDENRWYSNFGPLVGQFEDRLELHLSTPEDVKAKGHLSVVTTSSCYDALQIGLKLLSLPAEAQVLIPAVTFPACPLAVRHAGAEAILADIDSENWQLTPEIAKNIAAKTPLHAVMPVALYGVPVDGDAWDDFTDETGIPVLIDAAAALEAQKIPAKAMVAHSLHATKPFCIGEGGVLIGRDAARIDEARCLSNFGTIERIAVKDGINSKLSEYAGAVALAQLDRWPDLKERRRALFTRYQEALVKSGLPLSLQKGVEETIVSTLMLKSETVPATTIADTLGSHGIFAHRMYLPPLYHHPFFADLKVADGAGRVLQGAASAAQKAALMTSSEDLQQSVFGLPFHHFISNEDIDIIFKALTNVMDAPRSRLVQGL